MFNKIEPGHISDEEALFRRIHPVHLNREEGTVSSAAFRGRDSYALSVDWEKHTTPEETVKKHPEHSVASLKAKVPRRIGQKVEHTPSRRNKAHSSIIGKKTTGISRVLAKKSTLIILRG